MLTFNSNGVTIAYHIEGTGAPVLLIHGFASSARINWVSTGWTRALSDMGRQVIMIDNRGHGESEKLYDPARYEAPMMAGDAHGLLEHLGIECADVMGYSMGARITAFLAIKHPRQVRSAIFGGLAEAMFRGVTGSDTIADALEAPSGGDVKSQTALAFRRFAERSGGDLHALAACMRAGRPALSPDALATIACPVLVVAGENDDISGPVEPLVEAIPGARGVVLPDRDHMTAVGDRRYKQAVAEFLTPSRT